MGKDQKEYMLFEEEPEDGTNPVSLHARIRGDIARRILTGAWPPGHRIPSEHELMGQYDCSRMTVNKAISGLAEAGLVIRRRRAGSFVAPRRIEATVLDIPDIQAEVERRGQSYRYDLLSRTIRAPADGHSVDKELAGEGKLLELTGVHFAEGRPFAFEQRLISLEAVPAAADADFEHTPPGSWLLSVIPWTDARNGISAVHADPRIAAVLEVERNAACLQVDRETWFERSRVTTVRQIYPGNAYALYATFSHQPSHQAE